MPETGKLYCCDCGNKFYSDHDMCIRCGSGRIINEEFAGSYGPPDLKDQVMVSLRRTPEEIAVLDRASPFFHECQWWPEEQKHREQYEALRREYAANLNFFQKIWNRLFPAMLPYDKADK